MEMVDIVAMVPRAAQRIHIVDSIAYRLCILARCNETISTISPISTFKVQRARKSMQRGGRLSLNSVSVPIDGFPTDPFHRLLLPGIAQGGHSPTGAMSGNSGEFQAATATARPPK